VGGGLGVPGSKERVMNILRDVGYEEVIPVVEVSCLRHPGGWVHSTTCPLLEAGRIHNLPCQCKALWRLSSHWALDLPS
jgi:hypothetical protein